MKIKNRTLVLPKPRLPRSGRRLARVLILVLIAAAVALALLRHRADTAVTVTLPTQPVTLGGQEWDNRRAAYPLLSYRGVTYLPETAVGSLGLKMERTAEAGLSVSVTGEAQPDAPETRALPNPKRSSAAVLDCPITVVGVPYDNAEAPYPFLEYRGVTYLPLTVELCSGPLCLSSARSADGALSLRATGKLRPERHDLPHFILHMGGITADGQLHTNSIEAANHSYDAGYRWLELDFNWTSDGALACLHDWGNLVRHQLGLSMEIPLSSTEFERVNAENPAFQSFTPKLLKPWLEAHPDAMIVTDVKEDNVRAMQWLAEHYPDLRDRMIVQIYSIDEYEPICALGYENIILTMYRIPWAEYRDLERLADFIGSSRILAVTIAAQDSVRDVFDYLVSTGIPVYVYTPNEPAEQTKWASAGAYGMYTDYGDVRAAAQ
ncbi:MAG: hypothetical protein IJ112_00185 [Oscillospiraceae bacterium]|nr:hypothetical protein [Oscillospiraceae bacterium]